MNDPKTGQTDSISVFVDAEPFSWRWFAGVPRYTARLCLALAAQGANVRFLDAGKEITPLPGLHWSQDQDVELWARKVWHGERMPLGAVPPASMGLYSGAVRPPTGRLFRFEVSILYDFCPSIVGWTFPDTARLLFEKFFSEDLLKSDVAIAISHATKADAAWLSPMPQDRIKVAYPGMSLCLETHRHKGRVARSPKIGLAVSTVETAQERRLPARLVSQHHRTAARYGVVVGRPDGLVDVAS